MHLTQAQQTVLFSVQSRPELQSDFEVLCAGFEAALDEVERPVDLEKTEPFGVIAIRSESVERPVESIDAVTVIAAAWLEMIADAIMTLGGELEPGMFDEDGVSLFSDTRPLFQVAHDCGFGPAHARRAFSRMREEGRAVPRRAMRILGCIRAIKVPRRKSRLADKGRIARLQDDFAVQLEAGEIARAKAGSIYYSLVAAPDGYNAVRSRRTQVMMPTEDGEDALDVVGEVDVDVMDGFNVPLVPCEELHGTALAHFIQFLDEESERKPRYTYQRLVHRAIAA